MTINEFLAKKPSLTQIREFVDAQIQKIASEIIASEGIKN